MKTLVAGALLALVLAGCASRAAIQGDAGDWGCDQLVRADSGAGLEPQLGNGGDGEGERLRTPPRRGAPQKFAGAQADRWTASCTQDTMTGWVHLIPCSADLIVIQLSENYQGGVSLEEYQGAYEQMIDELCENGRKTVVCVGPLEKHTARTGHPPRRPENRNAIYVSLREIYADPANHAAAEGKFPKLGDMPGDRGMRKIAEAILESLVK